MIELPGAGVGGLNNLGLALDALGRYQEAIEAFRASLELDGTNAQAFYNLGNAYRKLGDFDGAMINYDRAIDLQPAHADSHVNRACVLLARGDFQHGWAEYEWRFAGRDYPRFEPPWPIWRGEPLAGRTLVLVAEQGLGDTLQFVRYASVFHGLGARVKLLCTSVLHPLLARTPGIENLLVPGKTMPPADFCLPLMSAPHRLGTTVETVPTGVPYLFADPVARGGVGPATGEHRGIAGRDCLARQARLSRRS